MGYLGGLESVFILIIGKLILSYNEVSFKIDQSTLFEKEALRIESSKPNRSGKKDLIKKLQNFFD